MKVTLYVFLLVCVSMLRLTTAQAQSTHYVKPTATGTGDGSSWTNASADLQAMINASQSGDAVWVAAGVYKPTTTTGPDSRTISFTMKNGVAIYGGFVGTEQNLSDRPAIDPVADQPSSTTLSGEIGDPTSTTDNSLHVLYNPASLSLTASAVLDGFVITGGNASRGGFGINYGNAGGGMYNDNSSPTLTNCLFQSNQATTTSGNGIGGAICNLNSSPILTSCVLQSNSAVGSQVSFGGAIYNAGGSPSLTNCVLRDNQAYGGGAHGGAIYNDQTNIITLTNCRLLNNSATPTDQNSGANGGAIYNDRSTDTRLSSCTLTGNSTIGLANGSNTLRGGAIWASGTFSLTDCLLTDNAITASGNSSNTVYGGALYGGSGTLTLTRCTFRNNAATGSGTTSSNTAYGGAIFNNVSSLLLANCSFLDNVASGSGNSGNTAYGGAIASSGVSLSVSGCSFRNNAVLATGAFNRIGGGAVYMTQGSPILINSSFQNNRASAVTPAGNSVVQNSIFGGAFYNQGSNPSIINCSLLTNTVSVSVAGSPTNNSSTASGGAFYNAQGLSLNSNVRVTNSVLWDNGGSNAIANPGGSLTMTYSLYEPSSVTAGVDVSGPGNLTATTSPFVSSSSVALATGSPAINAGNPASVTVASGPYSATALPATDLVGNARIVGGRVDMGAVETPCAVPTRLYVASSQTAVSGDGLSWQTAFPDLQTALTYPCSQSLTEIWVAGGTYKPTSTTARDISFAMLPNVKIYGGFVGTEQNLSDRPAVNPVAGQPSSTTLSGEIGDPTSTTDNSLHVLYNPASLSLTASAVLDGFVITGGNASRGGFGINYGNAGGGMYNDNSSPTLTNCLFQSNQATTTSGNGIGGAIYNLNSSPALTSCVLQSNSAVGSSVGFGGAIYNAGGSPSLTNCVLRDNQAYGQSANGGAINNAQTGMVTLTNCRLLNNSATTTGLGAGAYGGAIYNDRSTDTRLISCTLTGNSTIDLANGSTIIRGGAIWASGTFSLTDCLLTDNAATGSVALSQNFAYGGALYGGSGTLTLTRCTFRNNAATASGATSSNTAYGGAIFNNASSLLLTNCSFLDNVATGSGGTNNTAFGGAIANFSSLTLTGCSFQNNAVLATGATNRIGGGAVYMAQSSPVLINSSFQNNRASAVTPAGNSTVQNSVFGGAFYNEGSSPSLINCSLLTNTVSVSVAGSPTNNSSTASGGAFYNAQRSGLNSSNVQLVNSVLWDNGGSNAIANPGGSLTMTYSLYEPSSVTTGVDVSGLGNLTATTSPFVSSSSVALATGSPAINAGNPASVTVVSGPYSATALPATDLVGNARIVAGRVDMGAVETPCAVPTRLYVASSQTAVSGDGLSWQTAFPDLQTALTYPCSQSLTEIWVAKGTYKPIYGQGFSMLPNVKIIGGFVGSETAITGRPAINPVNGQPSSSTLTGNGNSVIVNNSNGLTASAVLDGFVITGGNTFNGGAIFNNSSSPTFVNCLLTGNKASYGGAIYSYTSNATFVNCALTGNTAEYLGGAIYISGGSPSLINCSLTGNTASSGSGGAIFNESSSPSLTNCSLTGNTAPSGGAIFNYNSSNPVLTNCSLTNNTAPSGGAIYNESGSPVLTNAVVWNNGGANTFVNNNNSTITAHYSLFDASVTGYTTDPTNLTTTTSPFVSSSSVALATGSPAINAGNPASVTVASGPYSATALPATDLVGNARIVGGRVDMGAVENTCPVPTRLYVAASQTAVVGDGLSWQTAFPDLKSALTYLCSQSLTEIWVAQGTYKPEGQDFFTMLPNVKIIGGFVGNETAITGRPAVNPVNGQPSSSTLSSNGNAIISNYRNGLTATAVLDGFVITGGGGYIGGAIYNNNTSPSFVNCLLTGNKANSGGAIYNAGGSPSLINCALTGNTAEYLGGAIYISGGSPSLINCSLTGNKADYFGGGAIYNENSSNPSLINCSLTGNTAPVGGAIYNTNSGLTLTNAVVWNNGGANTFVNNNNSTITAHYSLFDASVTGYTTDPTNLTTTTSPFVSSTSVALIACAPAINAGAPTSQTAATGPYSVTALPTTDLSGNQRIVGGRVDMGAVEFQGTPNYPVAFTLSPSSGTAVCVGSPVSIPVSVSGTGPVYQWYKDGTVLTGVASATTATLSLPSATTADAGSYSVVVTGACNSLTSTAFSLTVNSPPVPTLTASASSTLTCAAPSLTLIASGGTGGPFSYTFAGPGIVSQQAASGTAVVNAAGVYSVTVTNAVTGCWASTTVTVFSNTAVPSVSINASTTLLTCTTTSATLTASGTAASYVWTGNNTSNPLIVSNPGLYSVTAIATSNGCISTTSVTIGQDLRLPTFAVSSGSACTGNTVSLTATGCTGSVAWPGGITGSVFSTSVAGTYTATCTVGICSTTASGTVTINALPNLTITAAPSLTICLGTSTTLNASGGSGFAWSNSQSSSAIEVSPVSTTAYSVTVTNTTTGCRSTTSVTVTVNTPPSLTVTGNPSFSINQGGSTTLTASGAATYRWSTGEPTASISVTASGPYSVTGTSASGCSSTSTVTVEQRYCQTTLTTSAQQVCIDKSVSLTATAQLTSPAPSGPAFSPTVSPAPSYTWVAPSGASFSGPTNTAVVSASFTTTGVKNFTAIVATAEGCISSNTVSVTVNALPSVSITATPSLTIALGQSTTLIASGATTYQWSNGSTTATNPVSPTATTTYSVTGTTAGCSSVTSTTVTVLNNLTLVAALSPSVICAGASTTASVAVTGSLPPYSYTWTAPADVTLTGSGSAVTASSSTALSGVQTLTVVVSGSGGSSTATTTLSLTVNPATRIITQPQAQVAACLGSTVSLSVAAAGSGSMAYQWYKNGNLLAGQTSSSLSLTGIGVNDAAIYGVVVTAGCGSATSTSTTLTLNGLYVTQAGAGLQNGTSWSNAYSATALQTAINQAASTTAVGCPTGMVWIGAGIYTPTSGTDRSISFNMRSRVLIYGGFVGNELFLSQRPASYYGKPSSTTLSGDIGAAGNTSDNSYHVVYNRNVDSTALLNGVVISGGNAVSSNALIWFGGGVFNDGSSSGFANPRFEFCTITNNQASQGGGMAIVGTAGKSSPTLTGCNFVGNMAPLQGGGLFVSGQAGGLAKPVLRSCVLFENQSQGGTAIATVAETSGTVVVGLRNCTLLNNTTYSANVTPPNRPTDYSLITLVNCIVRNTLNEWYNGQDNPTSTTISYSALDFPSPGVGTGNTQAAPQFVNEAKGDLRLQASSPLLNAGDPASTTALVGAVDGWGQTRIVDGRVDMGAFEYQGSTPTVVYTIKNGNWSDNATWNVGRPPMSAEGAGIYHVVQVNGSFPVGQMTFGPGGQLVFGAGNQVQPNP